ncbi:DUF742 domain-containing protein [Allokutzneria sp. A3M-2-11 16]|uniref:DUF742 domain-containing protein n=1 Tax=Allokutzneria sp. A3M-2-11 16 TaxID=2962043 RepID=UPI0020B7A4D5|nr:DUF742 domain-containing protein [Allokutzneria sp. A3M-2-11 16]MCP3805008.1 DUF742 domain-containing protein [Allokutzneria sp. A3M-2-11 16]
MTPHRREDLVRPFVLTGGRARSAPGAPVLDVAAMVTAVPGVPAPPVQPESLALLEQCAGRYLSVVELAAAIGQPLGIARVLIGDLLASGHLKAATPDNGADRIAILERMLHGLQAL